MSDVCILSIGKYRADSWISELPIDDHPILNFVFLFSDKKIERVKDIEEEILYECKYVTKVTEVKKRFDYFHFTIDEIDKVLSEITGIPLPKIETAVIGYDNEFYEYYDESKLSELEEDEDDLYNLKSKIEATEVGNYIDIRRIRLLLDSSNDDDDVYLDMRQILGYENSPDKFDAINIVSEDSKSEMRIATKYVEMAKVHFTEWRFNLVYIELFIALEAALKNYLINKSLSSSKKGKKLDSIFKPVGMIDLVKFSIEYIGKKEIDRSILHSVTEAYNRRNNVVHNDTKIFRSKDAIEAIDNVEKIIDIIGKLP